MSEEDPSLFCISLLIISCIIEYVTNNITLNLEPLSGKQSNQLLLKESLVLSKIHLTQDVFLFTISNQHNIRSCSQI